MVNLTRTKTPTLPYEAIKNHILGKTYDVSLALIGRTRALHLNQTLRSKHKPANVLALPLSNTSGEITLCLETIKKEASRFNHTFTQHVGFLFIHGLLHLKGMDHGDTMEHEEERVMNLFKLV